MPENQQLTTIGQWRADAISALTAVSDAATMDADLMLAAGFSRPRSWLRANADATISTTQQAQLDDWLRQRLDYVPLAYLLGNQPFWTLELTVTPDTLVPRPETELLVERALALLQGQSAAAVADLGTGSGNIALALASERPDLDIVATDRSAAALSVATANAAALGIRNVRFAEGDWCQALGQQSFALIVSNPPYVEADYPAFANELRAEPRSALASGADGLDDIRRIAGQAGRHLFKGGYLLLEHGHMQADAVSGILRARRFGAVRLYRDLAGLPRVTEARLID